MTLGEGRGKCWRQLRGVDIVRKGDRRLHGNMEIGMLVASSLCGQFCVYQLGYFGVVRKKGKTK